ncbi:GNAT family N-acetyltransferase [Streptomyces drozdowiczii]|uniref:GNAT family N-acetyltransferase n=1 Tax=Streptomyces drozdowiczii TaxID=202862 RepID=A0ABY6PMX1_9ACTN|nr:GNAT family N-acetyltransferase [Streptomyces drozdowiczii]MCX0247495.1 GNAT family N-acetyltransferase [Streptomyces drozdowiczii]UZK53116.1 GNAT family N-acetyltransferase [Streptomyces drozdowiczii]
MTDLETPRLVLHPMTPADAEHVAAGSPPAGARWAPGYPSPGERGAASRYLATCADTGDPSPFCSYGIRLRTDGLVIGGIGFHGAPDDRGGVTIGYGLVESARGRGYASEALRALLRFAREQGVARVRGDADADNVPSQRVMTAAGMRLVGEDASLKYYLAEWAA